MLLRAASVAVLAAALVSGCSSSGAPAKPRGIALSDVVLQDADLPAGWTSAPHTVKGDEDTQQTKLLHCLDAPDTRPHIVGSVQSPDYVSDQGRIASEISRYASQADVDRDAAALRQSTQQKCREKVTRASLVKQLPDGTDITKIEVTVDTSPKGLPADAKAVVHTEIELSTEVKATVEDPKPKPKLSKGFVDVAYLFGRRIEATITFTSSDEPVDSDLESRVISKVGERIAKI